MFYIGMALQYIFQIQHDRSTLTLEPPGVAVQPYLKPPTGKMYPLLECIDFQGTMFFYLSYQNTGLTVSFDRTVMKRIPIESVDSQLSYDIQCADSMKYEISLKVSLSLSIYLSIRNRSKQQALLQQHVMFTREISSARITAFSIR